MTYSDSELLRQFIEDESDIAFRQLVERHARLVYLVARRQLNGDAHLARDAVQAVFIDLSRKARLLLGYESLTGWPHTSTRYAASKLARMERARARWRLEVAALPDLAVEKDDLALDWGKAGPLLDELIQQLQGHDREALLMRFFENCPYERNCNRAAGVRRSGAQAR